MSARGKQWLMVGGLLLAMAVLIAVRVAWVASHSYDRQVQEYHQKMEERQKQIAPLWTPMLVPTDAPAQPAPSATPTP